MARREILNSAEDRAAADVPEWLRELAYRAMAGDEAAAVEFIDKFTVYRKNRGPLAIEFDTIDALERRESIEALTPIELIRVLLCRYAEAGSRYTERPSSGYIKPDSPHAKFMAALSTLALYCPAHVIRRDLHGDRQTWDAQERTA